MALRKPIAQTRRDRAAMIATALTLTACATFTAVLFVPMTATIAAIVAGIGTFVAGVALAFTAAS